MMMLSYRYVDRSSPRVLVLLYSGILILPEGLANTNMAVPSLAGGTKEDFNTKLY